MGRMDQHIGLNDWATENVYENHVAMQDSGQVYTGMFETEYPLMAYVMPNGTILYECVQADPWSSGPCFFLALKDRYGNIIEESLWTEAEMEAYL